MTVLRSLLVSHLFTPAALLTLKAVSTLKALLTLKALSTLKALPTLKALLTLTALLTLAPPAFAHTRLLDSVPADGAVLESSPTSVVLRFSAAVRVVRLALADAAGNPVELPGPDPGAPAAKLDVELPGLPAGDYALSWAVMGGDTHKVSGTLHFSIRTDQ